eukprot:6196534-Pleurochrysis_carterae.AAC.3
MPDAAEAATTAVFAPGQASAVHCLVAAVRRGAAQRRRRPKIAERVPATPPPRFTNIHCKPKDSNRLLKRCENTAQRSIYTLCGKFAKVPLQSTGEEQAASRGALERARRLSTSRTLRRLAPSSTCPN